jgi:O-antigen/teichoic acid export membrane protein
MGLLLVPFAQIGLGHGITRYFPKSRPHHYAFFTFTLFMSFLGFTIIGSLFLIFQEAIVNAYSTNAPSIINYLFVVILITFFGVVQSIFESFSRSFIKTAVPSFLRDIFLRIGQGALVLSYFLGWLTFNWVIFGTAMVYGLTVVALIIYALGYGHFKFDWNWKSMSFSFKKQFLTYSLITLLGTAGAILIMKIDSLMVSSMIGLEANAIYTIAFSIAVVIEMPRRAISQIAMPIISEKFAAGALEEIHQLYKKIATHQTFVCLFIFLLIWVNIDILYHFVPNSEIYEAGKWVVLLIGLGKLSDVIFSVNGEIIVFSRFYVFNITATLIMCVAVIVFNLLLIPSLGIEGAALASLLAMTVYNLLKYFYVRYRLGFDPFTWSLGGIVFIGLTSWLIGDFWMPSPENLWLKLILHSGAVSSIYLAGNYWLNTLPDLKNSLLEQIKSWRS